MDSKAQNVINAVELLQTLYSEIARLFEEVERQFFEAGFVKCQSGNAILKQNSNSLNNPNEWMFREGVVTFTKENEQNECFDRVYFAIRLYKTEFNIEPIAMMGIARPISLKVDSFKIWWPEMAFGPRTKDLRRFILNEHFQIEREITNDLNPYLQSSSNTESSSKPLFYTFNNMGEVSYAWFKQCIHFYTPLLTIKGPDEVKSLIDQAKELWDKRNQIYQLNHDTVSAKE